jgi:hypothetical protein
VSGSLFVMADTVAAGWGLVTAWGYAVHASKHNKLTPKRNGKSFADFFIGSFSPFSEHSIVPGISSRRRCL